MKSLSELLNENLLNESLVVEGIEGDYTQIVLSASTGEYTNLPQGVSNDDDMVQDFRTFNKEIFDDITSVINKLTKMDYVETGGANLPSTIRTWEFTESIDNKLLNKVISAYKKAYKTTQFPEGIKHDISKVRPSMFISFSKEVARNKYINGFVWLHFK